MKRAARAVRKLIVALIGIPLFIVGIILIPLPGPGLIVIFVALLILSMEFDWANRHLEKAKDQFKKIYQNAQERADKFEQRYEDKKSKRSDDES